MYVWSGHDHCRWSISVGGGSSIQEINIAESTNAPIISTLPFGFESPQQHESCVSVSEKDGGHVVVATKLRFKHISESSWKPHPKSDVTQNTLHKAEKEKQHRWVKHKKWNGNILLESNAKHTHHPSFRNGTVATNLKAMVGVDDNRDSPSFLPSCHCHRRGSSPSKPFHRIWKSIRQSQLTTTFLSPYPRSFGSPNLQPNETKTRRNETKKDEFTSSLTNRYCRSFNTSLSY